MSFERSLCQIAAALVAVGIADGLLPTAEVARVPVFQAAAELQGYIVATPAKANPRDGELRFWERPV